MFWPNVVRPFAEKTELYSRKNGIRFPEKRNWQLLIREKYDTICKK